jgi:hypothetical protein
MKKSNICRAAGLLFICAFVVTMREFEGEGAGFFLVAMLLCGAGSIIYERLENL